MQYFAAENISKSFQGISILDGVSLAVNHGERVGLLGVSGVGKTTLFNILAGFLAPDGGDVFLKGRCITNQMGQLSYMQQEDLLFEHKKIFDNVCLPLILKGMKKIEARNHTLPFLKIFGLEGEGKKYPCQLSGGMRQRAAFLRTYLFSNDFFLLDEPFSALDLLTKQRIHDWFLGVASEVKATVLFITHDIDEAIFLSDRIYILKGSPGSIVREISLKGIVKDPGFFFTQEYMEIKKKIIASL